MMTYRGYPAAIEYDGDSRFFYGHVLGTRDTIGFEGRSVDELEVSFQRVIDEYVKACEEAGREPDRAYSGTIFIRTDPDTHRRVEASAAASGLSINQWAQAALMERLDDQTVIQAARDAEPAPMSKDADLADLVRGHGPSSPWCVPKARSPFKHETEL